MSTASGTVRGITENVLGIEIEAFLGIPYAQPPVNELRFEKPVPIAPWTGILEVLTS